MNQLKHYQDIANSLLSNDPNAHEVFEEEINIIIHKLKFIPTESRPVVAFINNEQQTVEPSYLQELLAVAGSRIQESALDPSAIEILIFNEPSPIFLSKLPEIISANYADSIAVKNNKIFIIQKAGFGLNKECYLEDTEILAEIVQSKYFFFGHEGTNWIQFELA